MTRRIFVSLLIVLFVCSGAWAFSGRTKWQVNLDSGLTSGIACSGNILLLGSETGRMYALDKNTGAEIWSRKGENSIKGTPSIVNDNVVFAQGDGTITCLKISDGSFMWQNMAHIGSEITIEDGTTTGDGMVFVSKSDGKLYALNDKNGHLLWTYQASEQGLREAPGFGDGLVFLGEYGGIMSIITPNNGKRISGGGAGGAINTPVVNNGKVYYSSWDGSVQSVQIKGVIPLWDTKVGDPVTSSPAVSANLVAVGTVRGIIAAIDNESGSLRWTYETNGASINGTPVIAEGLVFAGTESGTLYAIDAGTGRPRFTLETGSGIATDMLFTGGVLYFGNGAGVYAIQ